MIYIHIPFCRSFCTYCDFYSEVAAKCRRKEDAARQESIFSDFISALTKEISYKADQFDDRINTLYIGGGTPSVLPLTAYVGIIDALKGAGVRTDFTEFTVEVNPEDIVEKGEEYVEGLLALGVNRISMGVQSFDDDILRWMNRRHDSATAVKAYSILENAGADNISIDLIFGMPQLSDESWRETLSKALDISSRGVFPRHVSAYQLSVEPGSALATLVKKGLWCEASEDLCAHQYDILCSTLASAGYSHYEISNFAQPGYEAVHNSAYWSHVPYVGLGPGAHGLIIPQSLRDSAQGHRRPIGLSVFCSKTPDPVAASDDALSSIPQSLCDSPQGYVRMWNSPDLRAYVADPIAVQGSEILDDEQIAMERIMLALRTSKGINEDYLMREADDSSVRKALAEGKLIRLPSGNIRIPENHFFVSDGIISEII